jgi:tetratricopeptide (TPR) repeat protein
MGRGMVKWFWKVLQSRHNAAFLFLVILLLASCSKTDTYGIQEVEKVEQDIKNEISEKGETTALISHLAGQYLRQGKIEEAGELIKEKGNLSDSFTNFIYGNYYMRLNRIEEGQHYFNRSLTLDPTSPHPYYGLGNVMKEKGYPHEADKYFRKAIELNSTFGYAYKGLANSHLARKEFREAEEMYNKQLEFMPGAWDAYVGLGEVYLNEGDLDRAEEMFMKSIEINEHYSFSYRGLGIVYEMRGDEKRAKEFYEQAYGIEPDNIVVKEALERLG